MTTTTNKAPLAVSASRVIDASPEQLYDLVADVTRMGDWSPETVTAEWIGDADGPAVGARFKGSNAAGPNKWATKPTVVEAERGSVFAFKVPGKSGPMWRYEFTELASGGTRVTESMKQTHRSPLFIRLLQKRAGITDRAADLALNLETTLENLAQSAEDAR